MKRCVPSEQFDRFLRACSAFREILYETNRTMNLTRIPESEYWSKHIADSVSIAPYLKGKFNLCDVGCGAGFCYGCSRMMKSGAKRICKDGPVFDKEEIIW